MRTGTALALAVVVALAYAAAKRQPQPEPVREPEPEPDYIAVSDPYLIAILDADPRFQRVAEYESGTYTAADGYQWSCTVAGCACR